MQQPQRRRWVVAWCLGAAAGQSLGSVDVVGQVVEPRSVISTTDIYGNARPVYRDRRRVGFFQNEVQRGALQGYQEYGRREDRRGGFRPFALAGDPRALTAIRSPLAPGAAFSPSRFRAVRPITYPRYDGFGPKPPREPDDVSAILSRRYALIAMTALNAPVHRALSRQGQSPSLRSTIEQTPFIPPQGVGRSGQPQPLSHWLSAGVTAAHTHIKDEAWAWFRAGRYRRAARAFDTATLLDSSDTEVRVGAFFAYLAVGADATALAILGELNRRHENPFLPRLDLAEAFGDQADVRRLRVRMQVGAAPAERAPDGRAMRALALWHLGRREEARAEVTRLARDHPGGSYAAWPGYLRAAEQVLGSGPGRAQPQQPAGREAARP